MCLEDRKMTNTEILRFIVEELKKTELEWNTNKELFELICDPIPFGNDRFEKRKKAKETIKKFFDKAGVSFDAKRFDSLVKNIVCGHHEAQYRDELLTFLDQTARENKISIEEDLSQIVAQIPCKQEGERNYKTHFSNWLNDITQRINSHQVKKQLEQNFYFPPSLWTKGELTVKTAIREGVAKFVAQRTTEKDKHFETMRQKLQNSNTSTFQKEKEHITALEQMNQTDTMLFINQNYPLQQKFSQHFIQKMALVLYQKGYYALLANDIFPALDIHIQEQKEFKKLRAHVEGSPSVGNYRKAFYILDTITTDDPMEYIDIRTEAISNYRRHTLIYATLTKEEKIESIQEIIGFYQHVFTFNQTYHYYPAINLSYMLTLENLLLENKNLQKNINEIYNKTKTSIYKEKSSQDKTQCYYANITDLEFLLLKERANPIAELERYLDMEVEYIPFAELARTQRQMLFFIDTIKSLYGTHTKILDTMHQATEVIEDFMECSARI